MTEACQLILPFVKNEVAADRASRDFHTTHSEEYMALVERDGGLPGPLTARFGERLLDATMGAIFDRIAVELPALVAKVGHLMTWPDNSLCYNDQDESAVVVRAPGAMGIVQFIAPSMEEPHYASIQVLRQDDNGKPLTAESYLIPVGNGDMVRSIEAFRNGETIDGQPMMSFDYATRRVATTPAFLETKRYPRIASTIDDVNIDWKGRRGEGYEQGVHRFVEYDGLGQERSRPPVTPAL
ncbi:hypothetical protein HFN89_00495 [Rhizobium laguerreae]|nr:hypothetical protein [Rhizobium laguerreae]